MKKGWERKTLKEIAEYTIGLIYSTSDVSEEGMVVLRSSNVQNGKIDLSDLVKSPNKEFGEWQIQTHSNLMSVTLFYYGGCWQISWVYQPY